MITCLTPNGTWCINFELCQKCARILLFRSVMLQNHVFLHLGNESRETFEGFKIGGDGHTYIFRLLTVRSQNCPQKKHSSKFLRRNIYASDIKI